MGENYKLVGTCQSEKCGGFCCKTFHQDSDGKLTFAYQCKHLTKDNKCDIHETDEQPEFCKIWPKSPHKFFKLCQEHGCTLDFPEK